MAPFWWHDVWIDLSASGFLIVNAVPMGAAFLIPWGKRAKPFPTRIFDSLFWA